MPGQMGPRRYQGRDSLRDPKAEALKAETSQADRLRERLAQLQQAPQER